MSQRLAEISGRVAVVRQLGTVVNAMRGIASSRAQQSRSRLPALRAYAETVARAIADVSRLDGDAHHGAAGPQPGKPGLVVFGAEQGFAGGFPEQCLAAAATEFATTHVFLIGSRSASLASERGLIAGWTGSMPSGVLALTDTASDIVEAIYAYLAETGPISIQTQCAVWEPGRGVQIVRRCLLPLASDLFISKATGPMPLMNLPVRDLLARLSQEYVFAQIYEALVETFTAENEARAATMASAKSHIDDRLATLEGEERRTRQDEITAEVVELAAGMQFRLR